MEIHLLINIVKEELIISVNKKPENILCRTLFKNIIVIKIFQSVGLKILWLNE